MQECITLINFSVYAKEVLLNEGFVELKAGKWELSRERIKKFKEEIKSGQA